MTNKISLKKIYSLLLIIPAYCLQAQSVGINTVNPTKTLDVNGELRIRILPSGDGNQQIIVSDQDGNMLKTFLPKAIPSIGDIKDGYNSADHEGWYLLNGRALSSIPAAAQANAASLGFTGNLPDFSGKYTKMAAPTESVNTVTGSSSYALSKANIPNFSMTAVTAASGAHAHSIPDMRPGQLYEPGAYINGFPGTGYFNNSGETDTTSTNGAHTHTITLNSNGGGQAISLAPSYIALNTFVYLGN